MDFLSLFNLKYRNCIIKINMKSSSIEINEYIKFVKVNNNCCS